MNEREELPNVAETRVETSLDVLRSLNSQFEEIVDLLTQIRFYALGTFVTITVIGALYAFFLIYALVIIPRQT